MVYTYHIDKTYSYLSGKNFHLKTCSKKKEFELLSFLARNPNKVFNRDELLEKVWGTDVYVVERTVDVHIRKLREKIPEYYIKTLKGVGYLFSIDPI